MSAESENPEATEGFKEAMARWVAGVAVVAARDPDDGRVYATTVNSLVGISADPPRVGFSLGPGAQVLPFLDEDAPFAVSVLGASQRDLASRFTDPFPVGPSPFAGEGVPFVRDAHARLRCSVEQKVEVGSSRLFVGRVREGESGEGDGPLVYYNREYRSLK